MLLLQGVTANVVLVKPMVVEVCVGEYNSDPCMKLAVGMFVAGFVADAVAVDFEHRWCMAVVVAVAVVDVDPEAKGDEDDRGSVPIPSN